jgi:hypothetical protein
MRLGTAADGDSNLVLARALRYTSTNGADGQHPDQHAPGRKPWIPTPTRRDHSLEKGRVYGSNRRR